MKSNLFLSFALLSLLCASCMYEPEGKFINPVVPPDLSQYSIELDDLPDGDTIKIWGPTTFRYRVEDGDGYVTIVQAKLDGVSVFENSASASKFTLGPQLRTGIQELKIEAVASSGTGSLADAIDAEKVTVWRRWILQVDVEPPPLPQLKAKAENGLLTLSWNRYTKPNFVRYLVRASIGGDERVIEITDPAVTSWVDSTCTGYKTISYYFTVTNSVSSRFDQTMSGRHADFDVSYNTADSMVTLNITPTPYYQTFKEYVIQENGVERMRVGDPLQRTFSFKLNGAGYNIESIIGVKFYTKRSVQYEASVSKTLRSSIRTRRLYAPLETYFYSLDHHAIVGYRRSGAMAHLVLYDDVTVAPRDSFQVYAGPNNFVPYRGTYGYYAYPRHLVRVHLTTGHAEEVAVLAPGVGSGPNSMTVGTDRYVSYGWFGSAPGTGVLFRRKVYDWLEGREIFGFETMDINESLTISDDGRFLRSATRIYRLDAGTVTHIGDHPAGVGTWSGFRSDRCDEMLMVSGRHVRVYDVATLTLKRTVSAPGEAQYRSYDAARKKLLFSAIGTGPAIYSVDVETGTAQTHTVNAIGFTVVNGILFTPQGEYFTLY